MDKIKHTKRIGVFGGTFDPPHNAHVELARVACEQCELDELIVMPAGVPVYKLDKHVTPAYQRLEMCKIAFGYESMQVNSKSESDCVVYVSDMEIKRAGKTYTAHTLIELNKQNPNANFYFIAGADTAITIPKWRDAETVSSLATIIIAERNNISNITNKKKIECGKFAIIEKRFNTLYLHAHLPNISSTEIRYAVQEGKSVDNLVPPLVAEYILKKNLYRQTKRQLERS